MTGANFGIILNAGIVILDCSPNAIKPPWHFILFSTHLGIENLKNHLALYIYIYIYNLKNIYYYYYYYFANFLFWQKFPSTKVAP